MSSRIYQTLKKEELDLIIKNTFNKKSSIRSQQILKGGKFNTTYFIETTHPNKRLVLRVAPIRQELLLSFQKRMMRVEPMIYEWMEKRGVPVPKVILHDRSYSIIQREYLITEYIENTFTFNHDEIPPSERKSMQQELGIYTARIHSIKGSRFGWPNPDGSITGSDSWSDILILLIKEITDRIADYGVFSENEIKRVLKIFQDNHSLFEIHESPTLIHNDLWNPNIRVKEKAGAWVIAAIIDVETAMFADRELESILWINEPDFTKGYGIPLNLSAEARFRRNVYVLKKLLLHAYMYKVMFENESEYQSHRNQARGLLERIESNDFLR